ncbi:MAG TPA: hypothetical protein VLB29_11210 [Nocardioidaceae bacterium]|nr:hypothetical protein [Nocardioidaceae bacterium]
MTFEPNSGDAENSMPSGAGGISRRSVVKAGAVAAWSVPLVQVVAAAPAMAAVSGTSTLGLPAANGSWSGNSSNLNGAVTISNTGSVATTSLQVTMDFDAAWTSGSASAPGWTVTPSANATTKTYVFTATTQLAAGDSTTLSFTFASTTGKGFATNISVTANAANAASTATAIPITARTK